MVHENTSPPVQAVPTMNQEALFPMRQEGRTSDDYWTPKWLFDALGIKFDLDVACPPEGPAHTPATHWYTQETDGLASPWFGNVWMNPPFSKTNNWAYRFIEHKNGICLVPMGKTKWFARLWEESDAVMSLPPNLKFDQGGIFIQTCLFAFGVENVEAMKRSKIGRVR
jgi:hypothetical protein